MLKCHRLFSCTGNALLSSQALYSSICSHQKTAPFESKTTCLITRFLSVKFSGKLIPFITLPNIYLANAWYTSRSHYPIISHIDFISNLVKIYELPFYSTHTSNSCRLENVLLILHLFYKWYILSLYDLQSVLTRNGFARIHYIHTHNTHNITDTIHGHQYYSQLRFTCRR